MGGMECAGCTMIAFGPSLAIFLIVIARDPLRIILFVAGAFFWLLALLLSALLWFPLKDTLRPGNLEFGLFFSVAFQEAFRFVYFLLLKKAETGLEKVSQNGMHIEGVHSLKNAKHTIALVCGLGFGFMSGAFAFVNVLADSNGPGTVGFPASAKLLDDDDFDRNISYTFFFTSALSTSAFILLHVMWNIIFWYGCRNFKTKFFCVIAVVASHFLLSGLSLVNRRGYHVASLPITYIVLCVTMIWAFWVAGGSVKNLKNWMTQTRGGITCRRSSDPSGQAAEIIQPERASM